jgi:hypothetical protein
MADNTLQGKTTAIKKYTHTQEHEYNNPWYTDGTLKPKGRLHKQEIHTFDIDVKPTTRTNDIQLPQPKTWNHMYEQQEVSQHHNTQTAQTGRAPSHTHRSKDRQQNITQHMGDKQNKNKM